MVSTVIVPLDGSERSAGALVPAQAIAERAHAALLLITAHWSHARDESTCRELEARALAIQHSASVVPTVELRAVRDLRVPHAIETVARRTPGAAVCMATRGHTALGTAVLGSVARAVIRRGIDRLVLVGPASRPGWSLRDDPRMIVYLDDFADALSVVGPAADLAIATGCYATIVFNDGASHRRTVDAPNAGAPRPVDLAAKAFADRGVATEVLALESGDPARALLGLCEALRDAVFVALSMRPRLGMPLATLGGVGMDVVRHAPVPVLVHRPPVPGEAVSGESETKVS